MGEILSNGKVKMRGGGRKVNIANAGVECTIFAIWLHGLTGVFIFLKKNLQIRKIILNFVCFFEAKDCQILRIILKIGYFRRNEKTVSHMDDSEHESAWDLCCGGVGR